MKKHGSLNHIYRLVWSQVLKTWVAVAEHTKGRGKGKNSRSKLIASGLALASLATALPVALAGPVTLPSGAQVSAGSADVTRSGATLTVVENSQRAAINWQTFSIGSNATVDFIQPNSSAVILNRVIGTESSVIDGALHANGQVFLLNSNGVLFSKNASITTGGLVASTLMMSDADFMAGRSTFSASGTHASVINQGTLNADGGYVALLGNQVINQGTISAKMGTAIMASGDQISLNFNGNALVNVVINKGTLDALVSNQQAIYADGGAVVLTAKAADSILAGAVNNTGEIRAETIAGSAGKILLLGTDGAVNVGGTLDVSAPVSGNGGHIETSGASVHVADNAHITSAAKMGLAGSWLIDPNDFTIAASGGDITGAALNAALGAGNVTIATTSGSASCTGASCGLGTAGSGNINVNDTTNPVTWSAHVLTLNAYNNININAPMYGSGTAGLALWFGQGAIAAGNLSSYNVNAPVNLASSGSFSTRLGSNGSTVNYTIVTGLGAATDAATAPGTMTLQGMAATASLSGNYVLGANIDACLTGGTCASGATAAWNSGAGFTPIGTVFSHPFTGTFDGLGHVISNLSINRPATSGVGLFGYGGGSSIVRNIGLQNVNVTGSNGTGALVGYGYGLVSNAYATGTITGTAGSYGTGGLVGYFGGTIFNSYTSGTVNGNGDVGGLVGTTNGPTNSISNSYSTATVTGITAVGGLVGYQYGSSSTINNSYSIGAVAGTTNVGGLVGQKYNGTAPNSYWDTTTSGQPASAAGTGLTSAQMQTPSFLTGLNFTATPGANGNNWVIVNADGTIATPGSTTQGATFPMLASEYATTISNTHQLQLMAMDLTASYTLGQNIDASATGGTLSDVWFGSSFIPIGHPGGRFTGSFDGLGHTISNLTVNLPSTNYVGLFGYGASQGISNVGLIGASVTGNNNAGGLIGFNFSGTISNSYASGVSVTGGQWVGGLVGTNYGTVSNCYAAGTVNGSNGHVGGLVGSNSDYYGPAGTITNSYAAVNVTGSGFYVGGLAGVNGNNAIISNSYATGNVNGSGLNNVGGLVGNNDATATISNSYAAGAVSTVSNTNVGGLIGANYGTVSNSFYNRTVNPGLVGLGYDGTNTNPPDVAGAVWGLSSTAMQTQASFTSATGTGANGNGATGPGNAPAWDFTSAPVWRIVTSVNNSFPCLAWTPTCLATATPIYLDLISGSSIYGSAPAISAVFDTSPIYGNGSVIANATVAAVGMAGWSGAPTATSGVNSYTITPVISGISSVNSAYTLFAGNAASWNVTARPVTLTGSATYDGLTAVNGSQLSVSNTVNGDQLTVGGSGILAGANAGSESLSGLSGLTLNNANYTLSGATGVVTVAKAALTVTASNAVKMAGQSVTLSAFTSTGLVDGQTIGNVTETSAGAAAGAAATAGAGPYLIVPVAASGGSFNPANYTISFVDGYLTVTPAAPVAQSLPPDLGNPVAAALLAGQANDDTVFTRPAPLNGQQTGIVGAGFAPAQLTAVFGTDAQLAIISSPAATELSQVVTMSQARSMLQTASADAGSGSSSDASSPTEIRVPVSRNSLAEIVNGGVKLPSGVEQQLFVVKAQ